MKEGGGKEGRKNILIPWATITGVLPDFILGDADELIIFQERKKKSTTYKQKKSINIKNNNNNINLEKRNIHRVKLIIDTLHSHTIRPHGTFVQAHN